MGNELIAFDAERAIVKTHGKHYELRTALNPNETAILKRGSDFGVIKHTKRPSLLKSGAEKICMLYGLLIHYDIESKIEKTEDVPFFFYAVKCSLVKIGRDGSEYVFSSGYGSANTMESRNGTNGAYNAANNALKMAQKRALVGAAIAISGISDMFDQDMENEDFMSGASTVMQTVDDNAPITAQQIKRLYAIANDAGINASEAKKIVVEQGYSSTKDIPQKDYERICGMFKDVT